MSEPYRPIVFSMRLSTAEEHAVELLANAEGLPKTIYARHILRLAMKSKAAATVLPADLIAALNCLQAETIL